MKYVLELEDKQYEAYCHLRANERPIEALARSLKRRFRINRMDFNGTLWPFPFGYNNYKGRLDGGQVFTVWIPEKDSK